MFVNPNDFSIWGHQASDDMTSDASGRLEAKAEGAIFEKTGISGKLRADDPWKVHVAGMTPPDESEDFEEEEHDLTSWEGFAAEDLYTSTMHNGWWPEQMAQWNNALNWLQPGDIVCFHDLQNCVELNGVCAAVEGWDEASNRWSVRLSDGVQKFARSENLAVVQAQACDWGYGSPGSRCYWPEMPVKQPGLRGRGTKGVGSRTASFGSETTASSGASTTGSRLCPSSDSRDEVDADGVNQPWTTVMMRNIPNDYSGTMLLDLLDENGFAGLYNLVYLPMDYHRKAGFGYAFIDFLTTNDAQRFRTRFEGFSDWGLVSHKICNVSWSDALQGVQAHIDRYRNSPVMHDAVPDEFKPMLFEKGQRVPFPAPTKSIRAPRLRKKDPRVPCVQTREQRRPGLVV